VVTREHTRLGGRPTITRGEFQQTLSNATASGTDEARVDPDGLKALPYGLPGIRAPELLSD
jgi:hypothetical protein